MNIRRISNAFMLNTFSTYFPHFMSRINWLYPLCEGSADVSVIYAKMRKNRGSSSYVTTKTHGVRHRCSCTVCFVHCASHDICGSREASSKTEYSGNILLWI